MASPFQNYTRHDSSAQVCSRWQKGGTVVGKDQCGVIMSQILVEPEMGPLDVGR